MDELFYLEDLLPFVDCIELDLHTGEEEPFGCLTLESKTVLVNLLLRDKVNFKIKWQVVSIEKIEDKHLGGKDNSIEYDNSYYRYQLEPAKESK